MQIAPTVAAEVPADEFDAREFLKFRVKVLSGVGFAFGAYGPKGCVDDDWLIDDTTAVIGLCGQPQEGSFRLETHLGKRF